MARTAALLASLVSGFAFAAPGFVVDSVTGPRTDAIVLERVVYTGACPGNTLNPVRGYFFDPEVSTVQGRRVRIVNVTPGMSADPYPYTDRQYQSGGRSEKIDFFPRSQHGQRYFSVAEGLNDFEVTYSDGGRVVETKFFQFPVMITTRYQSRYPVCRVEQRCGPGPNGGAVCYPQTICDCQYLN
ncbi:MAG: hypothetical protein FJY29_02635 [Betaproteobacteria bacterium]|nr:hypothetical protein [Betaproteobacteria bacterium]